jgi:hypothetical protein
MLYTDNGIIVCLAEAWHVSVQTVLLRYCSQSFGSEAEAASRKYMTDFEAWVALPQDIYQYCWDRIMEVGCISKNEVSNSGAVPLNKAA